MECNTCGTLLPAEVSTCPRCGTQTSSSYDAIPYIDNQEYMKQGAPSNQPVASVTVEAQSFASGAQESGAVSPEQKAPQSQRRAGLMTALLIVLSFLLILGSIGSVIYTAPFRSGDMHIQATAIAQNFLTAQVRGTAQGNAYATTIADKMTPGQVYQQATSGTPMIDDPLKDDSGNVWYNEDVPPTNFCAFQGNAYHLGISTSGERFCMGFRTAFHDLAFQAQIKIIKGEIGGLVFRVRPTSTTYPTDFYTWVIHTDGSYGFFVLNSEDSPSLRMLVTGTSSAIATGLNQMNTVTVIARGSHLYLYVNGQFINSIIDTTYTSGPIGFTGGSNSGPVDVAFSNVKVWNLS
jgi:hypothetical protein